ncbi:hypothetical protein V1478_006800, partial [Vespula squamosa]
MSLDEDARRAEEEGEGGRGGEGEEGGGEEGGGGGGEGGKSFLLWPVSEAVTRLIHHKPNGKHEDAINSRANPCPASGLYYSTRTMTTTTTMTKKKKKKLKKIIGENICPAFARVLSERIGLTRGGHIYFGDSLSTRSLKIERLYKSSPIRERVLNARTSALPEKGVRATEKRRAPASEADSRERIYWTCLGEESRLVAVATSLASPFLRESQLNRSTVPKDSRASSQERPTSPRS